MGRFGYLIFTGLFFCFGCNEFQQAVKDAKKDTVLPPKDNYIILLDLSDRILFNNQQQVPKDIAVIKSIYSVFKSKLDIKDPTHLYYTVNDKLKVLVAPQRTTPKSLYDYAGNLRIDLSSEKADRRAAAIDSIDKVFNTTLPEMYKQAVIGNNSKAYSGADIWKYFSEDLDDDLDKDNQNTLFIITDGYMDLDKADERPNQKNRFSNCTQIINTLKKYPDWEKKFTEEDYGLLPVAKKFSNLRVILLQVNPKDDWTGEYALMTKIWSKWLTEMGITNFRFIKDENINEVRESVEKFMQVKIAGKVESVPWTKITEKDSSILVQHTKTEVGATNSKAILPATVNTIKPATIAEKKIIRNTEDVLPLDESDTEIFTSKKKDKPVTHITNSAPSINDSDILKDATPKKGFNTGIKNKKRNK
jgi:hypothetical protein